MRPSQDSQTMLRDGHYRTNACSVFIRPARATQCNRPGGVTVTDTRHCPREGVTLLRTNGTIKNEKALGYNYFGGARTMDVHIRRLRSKIEDADLPFIETIWNVGHRFRDPGAS